MRTRPASPGSTATSTRPSSRRKASNKPVLLYWGAQWCPPCKQLKSAVFSRPDFIEKSKLFVAVYLDGDLPDAQKWGDVFRVTGYPTVVVLKPDRTEITRIAGNMDLSLYARVLDDALGDVRPVKDVVALATKATRRWPPPIAGAWRTTPSISKTRACSIPRHCRAPSRMRRACARRSSPRSARDSTSSPRPRRRTCRRTPSRRAARRTRRSPCSSCASTRCWLTRSSPWRMPTRCADCRKSSTSAARQTLPQIAPGLRERVMTRRRRHHRQSAVRARRPARRAAHQDPVAKAYAPDGKVPTDVRSVALQTADEDAGRQAGAVRARRRGEFRHQHLHRARRLDCGRATCCSSRRRPRTRLTTTSATWPTSRSIWATSSARSSCWPRRMTRRAVRRRASSGATSISTDCCGWRRMTPPPSRRWASR